MENLILTDVEIVSDAPAEPVGVPEAKAWMKIAFNDDDTIIQGLITSARKMLEGYTGLSFIPKQYRVQMEINHNGLFELPYGPLVCMDTITPSVGVTQVGRLIKVLYNGTYTITYTSGFLKLPGDLKTDILRLVAWMYQNRGIQFESEDKVQSYPEWRKLAANFYQKVIL